MYETRSAFHQIRVTDIGQLRVLRFERNRQSSMFLDAPFDTDFEYPGYFHIALAINAAIERTLVVGLGGGTVVKRMWRDYPAMRVDVVELDPAVVDVARRFFALPDDERIRVVVGDGRAFVETTPDTYDLVIVDAFDDDHVPRPFTTEEFFRAARARLTPDGVFAINVIGNLTGERSNPFRSLYRTLANTWRRVWVFEISESVAAEGSNIVLFATDVDMRPDELHRRIEDRVGGLVTVPAFDLFGEDLRTAPIGTGDVPLIVDPPRSKDR